MKRRDILEAAMQAVTVDRDATHGAMEDNFARLAAIWSIRIGCEVTAAQVAMMMIDLKLVRAWSNPLHLDNWVDIAGYAACGGEVCTAPPDLDQPAPEKGPDQLDKLCAQIVASARPEKEPDPLNMRGARIMQQPPPVPAPCSPDPEPSEISGGPPEIKIAAPFGAGLEPAPKPKACKTGDWEDWEEETLIELAANGKTSREIAQQLDRSPQGTARKIAKFSERIKDMRELARLNSEAEDAPADDTKTPPPPAEGAATPEAVAEGTSEGGAADPAPVPEPRPVGTFQANTPAPDAFAFAERNINAHLNALGYAGGWDPKSDRLLAELICAGFSKTLGTRPILGTDRSRDECLARWHALNTDIGDLDHQAALLRVLKYRATEGQK